MHFPVRFTAPLLAVLSLSCCALALAQTQPAAQSTSRNTGGVYVATDPLAGVRYDNRYDISLGAAYARVVAGPDLTHGANLGGLDFNASYWLAKRWAVEGTARAYMGTSGAGTNPYGIKGPFVAEYFIGAGPEWLGPHNKHAALIAHAMFGGVYGNFEHDLGGHTPASVDFYPNQFAPAGIIGGHIDLNRSSRWVFRLTPDALLTLYNADYRTLTRSPGRVANWNFGISAGVEYKLSKKR